MFPKQRHPAGAERLIADAQVCVARQRLLVDVLDQNGQHDAVRRARLWLGMMEHSLEDMRQDEATKPGAAEAASELDDISSSG